MTVAWVLGWAVPASWFAAIAERRMPEATHAVFPATPDVLDRLNAAEPFDWTVGYSLGAQILLGGASRLGARRVALLAPIFSFASEDDLGGRVSRTQVRHLLRWLSREPTAALADFYVRAGLAPVDRSDVASTADLRWGLEHLAAVRFEPSLPRGWTAWCGTADTLLDAERLHALEPRVTLVSGASHHPEPLVDAWAKTVTTP